MLIFLILHDDVEYYASSNYHFFEVFLTSKLNCTSIFQMLFNTSLLRIVASLQSSVSVAPKEAGV